jgi:hypothetical protein
MKTIYKSIFILAVAIALAVVYTSCSDDNLPNNGQPLIKYIRITDPASADSLLVGGYQDNMIVIVGENLQDTRQIWFNDQPGQLVSTFITSTTVFTVIPSEIPKVITNKLTLVFGNGQTLEHDFKVEISEPEVTSMDSEYVLTGEVATIRGSFFYEPLTVTFTGGATGELVEVDDGLLKVKVPAGASPGPITIATNFGEVESDFWFRDNRNIFISSDPFTGWWNASFVVTNPAPSDPPAINGNYIRVKKIVGAWAWTEVAGGPASAMGPISKNIPDDAILHPENYNFKFEVNTVKPYNNNVIKFNVGINSENNDEYRWLPPYDTKGTWQTVVIPFADIAAKQPLPQNPNPNGYWTRILLHGPGELDADIAFDNFRVVPIK